MAGKAGLLQRIAGFFRTLRHDKTGNVSVFFAFAIIPMLGAIGLGFDFTHAYMTRSQLQGALDSGALAGAQTYFLRSHDSEALRGKAAEDIALKYMTANIPDIINAGYTPTITANVVGDNLLEYTASVEIDTSFARFFGFDSLSINVDATVTAGEARITEIVLALDNTSSMFDQARFVLMREAAKDFATKMFNQNADPTFLKISVVPWSTTVNIKSEHPTTPSSTSIALSTLPAAGSRLNPIAPPDSRLTYVKHPDTGQPFFSTSDVNTLFKPVEWRGCIRAADNEREINNSGKIKTPLTDAPPAQMRWPVNALDYRNDMAGYTEKSNCVKVPRNHNHGGGGGGSSGGGGGSSGGGGGGSGTQAFLDTDPFSTDALDSLGFEAGDELAHALYRNQCDKEWIPLGVPRCTSNGDSGRSNAYWPEDAACSTNGKTVNGTKKACVSDPNEFAYFASGKDACDWEPKSDILPWDAHKPIYGPNLNCPTAMLPLSSNRRQVIRKLDHMYPVPGGTHADVGLMWALRALSPRNDWASFWGLTSAQAPLAYNSEQGRKVVILLTDGDNVEASDYEGYWGCDRNSRPGGVGKCWRPSSIKKLSDDIHDDMMLDACTQIKDTYGIELYTIAVDINNADQISLLQSCATSADYAFNIKAAELAKTFDELAQTNLRIVR
ncbi:MAG: TadE/TadG family type IV pilus assembly protein [Pseudomonadota bacterium]